MEVTTDGGAPRTVLSPESSSWEIIKVRYSPNERWITFETYNQQIVIVPANGGQPREMLKGVSHAWDPAGHRLYFCTRELSGGTRLLSVDIDDSAGKPRASPKSAGLVTAVIRDLAVSREGHHLATTEMENSINLARLPLNASGDAPAGPEEMLTRGQVYDHAAAVSPDDKTVAYASNRLGHQELWLLHLDNRRLERLQLPGHDVGEWAPEWFPDGRKLQVLRMFSNERGSIWAVSADGSHAEELVPPSDILTTNEGVPISPDGRSITYSMLRDGFYQLFNFDTTTRQSRQLTFTQDDKYSATWSPDRRSFVYSSNAGGAINLWKMLASGGAPEQLTKGNDRVRHMFYSPDGRWLYFQPNHQNIYRMSATPLCRRYVQ
jgi:Tol biopolymer transport system component